MTKRDKKVKPPLYPSRGDGYGGPLIPSGAFGSGSMGAVGPTTHSFFSGPPIPTPSGMSQPLSGSLSVQSSAPVSATPVPTAAPQSASAQTPPATFADEIEQRAWQLLDGTHARLEDWFDEAKKLVQDLCDETAASKKADPSTTGTEAWLALQPTLEHMLAHGDASHTQAWVEEVCVLWWDRMTEIQATRGIEIAKCYRAMPAYILARQKFAVGDLGAALRWAALAHIADCLAGHPGSGGAEVVLRFGLGVPASAIELLKRCAEDALKEASGDWAHVQAFPEMVLTKALASDLGRPLVAPTSAPSIHASPAFLKVVLDWAMTKKCDSTEDKGKRLEWLLAFLCGTLPGAWAQRGFNALGFECEHDVVAVQVGTNVYPFPGGERALLVECKNWEGKVRPPEVGFFLTRMRYVGATLGILAAKSGLTGPKEAKDDTAKKEAKEAKNAQKLLEGYCQREHVVCLVVTEKDLDELRGPITFAQLLERKYRNITYGVPKRA